MPPICRYFINSLNALVKFRSHFREEETQAQRSEKNLTKVMCVVIAGAKLTCFPVLLDGLQSPVNHSLHYRS